MAITLNAIDLKRFDKLSLVLYALMGWLVVLALRAILKALPPLGMGLAAFLLRDRYTKADRQLGISALFLCSAGITEGAIPFAGKDFKRTWIACAIGVFYMLYEENNGGIVAITGVTQGKLWYVVDMLIGAAVIVAILFFAKPKLDPAELK